MDTDYRGLVPYLFYDDIETAMVWYAETFGFVERSRWTDAEGRVQNAEMTVGETELWLDGGGRRFFDKDGAPMSPWIGIWTEDPDAVYARMVAAGVETEPPEDKPYGVRMLTVTDPEGYHWGFMRRIPPPG